MSTSPEQQITNVQFESPLSIPACETQGNTSTTGSNDLQQRDSWQHTSSVRQGTINQASHNGIHISRDNDRNPRNGAQEGLPLRQQQHPPSVALITAQQHQYRASINNNRSLLPGQQRLLQQNVSNETTTSDVRSVSNDSNRGSISVSSLSSGTTDDVNLSRIIGASAGVALTGDDVEPNSLYVHKIVSDTIKSLIWPKFKFLTDERINKMEFHGRHSDKNILGILLRACGRENATLVGKIAFWKRYGKTVQTSLNTMKSHATAAISKQIKNGRYFG